MPYPTNFFTSFVQHAVNIGYQRSNKFLVLFQGPSLSISNDLKNTNPRNTIGFNQYLTSDDQKRLALTCIRATLSGKQLTTESFGGVGSGPKTQFPYSENYTNEVSFTFNCSRDMFERQYFTKWMQNIIDPSSHDVMLYSNYAKPWKALVVMLPPNISSFERVAEMAADTKYVDNVIAGDGYSDKIADPSFPIYYVRLNEIYPTELSENELSADDRDNFLTFTVKMKYKSWEDPMINFIERGKEMKLDQHGIDDEHESPFKKFMRIARDIARYSNPKEQRQLIVDSGLDSLNAIAGTENVEKMAQAGQVVDVFRQSDNKNLVNTQNKLIGPLGNII